MPWYKDILAQGRDVPPEHAARLVLLPASGRGDATRIGSSPLAMDVLGMAGQSGREGLGDSQALRPIRR